MSPTRPRRRRPIKKKNNTKKIVLIVALVAVVVLIIGLASAMNSGTKTSGPTKVRLVTSMGDIVIELRDDMPITTGNFKNLVQQGVYDGTIFHRVVNVPQNLVIIQGGDPTGTGQGDPSIPSIPDEFTDNNKNDRGTVAMANKGENYPNSGSSQFFINVEYNSHLDNLHPVFGRVIEGMDVVDQIANVETDANDRPVDNIFIFAAEIVD